MTLHYKLKIDKNLSFDELLTQLQSGRYKFVVYQYCISLFAITLRRLSPVILVEYQSTKNNFKYNLFTLLFGWWGIPWGPIYSIKSLISNNKGGINVTEDILLNINEQAFNQRIIYLEKTNQLFCKPDKWDSKSFKFALLKDFENDINVRKIIIGLFINSEIPSYVVGIQVYSSFEIYVEKFRHSLLKEFRNDTLFRFLNLKENNEENDLFKKQGFTILNK